MTLGRRPLPERSTPETRQERIKNLGDLVFEALRDARMSASSGLPSFETVAQESASRLRRELERREKLLHLEELSNVGLRHSRDKYKRLSAVRLRNNKKLRLELATCLTRNSTNHKTPTHHKTPTNKDKDA